MSVGDGGTAATNNDRSRSRALASEVMLLVVGLILAALLAWFACEWLALPDPDSAEYGGWGGLIQIIVFGVTVMTQGFMLLVALAARVIALRWRPTPFSLWWVWGAVALPTAIYGIVLLVDTGAAATFLVVPMAATLVLFAGAVAYVRWKAAQASARVR